MNSRDMKETSNIIIVKVMKSSSKIKPNHLLLNITLNDRHWRSQLDLQHLRFQHNNEGHHEKKSNLNNTLLLLFNLLTKNMMVLVYRSNHLVHFTMHLRGNKLKERWTAPQWLCANCDAKNFNYRNSSNPRVGFSFVKFTTSHKEKQIFECYDWDIWT